MLEENGSQTTVNSRYTGRAVGLLERIRAETTEKVNRDFNETLMAFKRKEIDSKTIQTRVIEILRNYPSLMAEFDQYLPKESSGQFSTAYAFVQKVRDFYSSEPAVYNGFIALLKDYQRGSMPQGEVVVAVANLLHSSPDLVEEFKAHYGPREVVATTAVSFPTSQVAEEVEPLLSHGDLESGVVRKPKVRTTLYISLFTIFLLISIYALFRYGFLDFLLEIN